LPFAEVAAKMAVPFRSMIGPGPELLAPVLMFFSNAVPTAVPSVFQSSVPFVPSVAKNNSWPLTLLKEFGEEPKEPA